MDRRTLSPRFYQKSTLRLARALIGKLLLSRIHGKVTSGIIVETEAYHGADDAACHSYSGRSHGGRTARTEVMFWSAGHLYVYFIYGNHYCCNVVTERQGVGAAVLIRALVPVDGLPCMMKRRTVRAANSLTSGPGNLCRALGISKQCNGLDLRSSDLISLACGIRVPRELVRTTARIGISRATHLPWRFVADANEVSRILSAEKR